MAESDEPVVVPVGSVELQGDLSIPQSPRGLVLFAHGSGSSRMSPRNRLVAEVLRANALATFLFDLLTVDEEARDAVDASLRFDIPFLAERLDGVTTWVREQRRTIDLPIGYFGASTGAAAALIAAAERPNDVAAVVSRGGRPDLAADWLGRVQAPTLLIVGGADTVVLELNRQALRAIAAPKRLAVVPGATHLFEEPGTLEEVADLAASWFANHLRTSPTKSATNPPRP